MRLARVQAARPARRSLRAASLLVFLTAVTVPTSGCGPAGLPAPRPPEGPGLVVGRRGTALRQVGVGCRLAHRFAEAYAARAYGRRPPEIPAETDVVRRALVAAATRVPPALRRLRPRLRTLRLAPLPGGSLGATAEIGAPRHAAFSVAFSVALREGRWMVTSISLPD